MRDIEAGDQGAAHALVPLVLDELRGLARAIFAGEREGHTLQPTALINEAWIKLSGQLGRLEDRKQFFAVASRAMRQVLTDHARRLRTRKRGDGNLRVTLSEELEPARAQGLDLVDLDDSLTRLAAMNARHAEVVELRILGGLTIAETAEVMKTSPFHVEEDWFMAKAWLRTELSGTR